MKNPCYVHALEVDSIISSVHGTIPEVINVPDIENTLSTSEQVAQGNIYDMYHQNSQNMQQESCGCGYSSWNSIYGVTNQLVWNFQWIYERSSYEMLLAVLKKRKKVTLFENFQQQHKRPRLQSPSGHSTNEDITKRYQKQMST